ncbi:hypothetical protein EV216_10682 [Rhodovulum steppense]|uniref:Uncharacterized protein n=2 Tax=Rhodovulum steppense TaxID=540251 RepID=A0A4R1YX49_9RHOB|nr:hypothetical protein EV216_10682 [Rhodovulum steppense]
MPKHTDDIPPRRWRRLIGVVLLLCIANYVMRLFSLSFLDYSALLPDGGAGLSAEEAALARYAGAWFEYALTTLAQIALSLLLYLVTVLREGVRLVRFGTSGLRLSLSSHALLLLVTLVIGGGILMILSNPSSLEGTRAGGPLAWTWLIFGISAMAPLIANLCFVIDPELTERAMQRTPRDRA